MYCGKEKGVVSAGFGPLGASGAAGTLLDASFCLPAAPRRGDSCAAGISGLPSPSAPTGPTTSPPPCPSPSAAGAAGRRGAALPLALPALLSKLLVVRPPLLALPRRTACQLVLCSPGGPNTKNRGTGPQNQGPCWEGCSWVSRQVPVRGAGHGTPLLRACPFSARLPAGTQA